MSKLSEVSTKDRQSKVEVKVRAKFSPKPKLNLARLLLGLFIVFAVGLFIFLRQQPLKANKKKQFLSVSASQARTVVAELRAISNVLVLDAKVVANPLFYFPAPSTGKLIKLNDGKIAFKATTDTTAHPLLLPKNSKAVGLLVPSETTVTKGLPVVSAVFSGFALQAQIPEEKIYRLSNGIISAKGEITNGPGPFEATILGVPFSPSTSYVEPLKTSQKESTSSTTETVSGVSSQVGGAPNELESMVTPAMPNGNQEVIVVASIPSDLKLVVGMSGLLALKIAEETSAVALPLEAVAGVSQKGQVYVVKKGKRILRNVSLGISDGSYIQITSGLKVGEKVALPSPSLKILR